MNNTRLQDDKTHCKYKYRDTAVTGTVCMRVSKIGNRTRNRVLPARWRGRDVKLPEMKVQQPASPGKE